MTAADDRGGRGGGGGGLHPSPAAKPDELGGAGRAGLSPARDSPPDDRSGQSVAPPEAGGFLSRWSRLKRGELREPPPAAPLPAAPLPAVPPPAAMPAEAPFDLSRLPALEALTAESDISLFLHQAVPQGLRQAALRRIWALDPAIRDFVGPVDYAWDFNAPGGLPGIAEALTGDVTGLLARAIGAEPPAAAAVAENCAEPQPEAVVQALPAALSAVAAPLAPAAAEAAAPLRRHGGAVPI